MFSGLKRNRTPLIVAALLILPLVVYRAQSRRAADANPLDRLVLLVSTPFEWAIDRAVRWTSDRWSRYVDLRGARSQNIELRRELIALERRIKDAEDRELENVRLRGLLGLRDLNPSLELVAGSVVALGHSPLERSVRIDRGLMHGVRRGMPVIAAEGLVGRVQRASFTSADVTLIADDKISLDVVVARSRARGRLRGSGQWPDYRLELVHVQRTDDVEIGDRVLSSGLGGVFPRGIPVGVVSKVETLPAGQSLRVEVKSAVDLTRVDQVLVVTGPQPVEEPAVTPDLLLPPELLPAETTSTASAAVPAPARPAVRLVPTKTATRSRRPVAAAPTKTATRAQRPPPRLTKTATPAPRPPPAAKPPIPAVRPPAPAVGPPTPAVGPPTPAAPIRPGPPAGAGTSTGGRAPR